MHIVWPNCIVLIVERKTVQLNHIRGMQIDKEKITLDDNHDFDDFNVSGCLWR
jgi:hypothetical protein